jgi:HEAT repeat protein
MRLDNDIVAKALARIGNPAIPGVENLMHSPDEVTRGRAIRILRNIDLPAACKALGDGLPQERNPDLKALIREGLQPSSSGQSGQSSSDKSKVRGQMAAALDIAKLSERARVANSKPQRKLN